MEATASDVLRRTAEIWTKYPTQGAYARNSNGDPISPQSPEAVCWCLEGARMRAVHELGADGPKSVATYTILSRISRERYRVSHTILNDTCPGQVPLLLSEVIKRAKTWRP